MTGKYSVSFAEKQLCDMRRLNQLPKTYCFTDRILSDANWPGYVTIRVALADKDSERSPVKKACKTRRGWAMLLWENAIKDRHLPNSNAVIRRDCRMMSKARRNGAISVPARLVCICFVLRNIKISKATKIFLNRQLMSLPRLCATKHIRQSAKIDQSLLKH